MLARGAFMVRLTATLAFALSFVAGCGSAPVVVDTAAPRYADQQIQPLPPAVFRVSCGADMGAGCVALGDAIDVELQRAGAVVDDAAPADVEVIVRCTPFDGVTVASLFVRTPERSVAQIDESATTLHDGAWSTAHVHALTARLTVDPRVRREAELAVAARASRERAAAIAAEEARLSAERAQRAADLAEMTARAHAFAEVRAWAEIERVQVPACARTGSADVCAIVARHLSDYPDLPHAEAARRAMADGRRALEGDAPAPDVTGGNVVECDGNGRCYGDVSAAPGRPKPVHVGGYTRRDGTFVQEHSRSAPRSRH